MIVLDRVTRRFETSAGEFTAVRDVSFTIAPGRFVSLVGPSGCGKTTLLGMIAGLVPCSEGRIYAPNGLVSQTGVENVVKSLDAFGVFKPGQKVDIASTYDMTYVRQAMKDLKLQ